MKSLNSNWSIALAATLAVTSANASGLSLNYLSPTGTVTQTEHIDLYVNLTLDASAGQVFTFNSYDPYPYGLTDDLLPKWGTGTLPDGSIGNVEFASYTSVELTVGYGCGSTFTNGCGDAPYAFSFAGPYFSAFQIAPGGSLPILLGTLVPQGGQAPVGTYTQDYMMVGIYAYGLDAQGNSIFGSSTLAETYEIFTRTVVAVPEPQTYVIALAGLLVLAGRVGRLRSTRKSLA